MTLSFCPKCYKKIPATIEISDAVYLVKKCCEEYRVMIEPDPEFYRWVKALPYNNILGHVTALDITRKCNTCCPACYSKDTGREEDFDYIVGLAYSAPLWIREFLLTGGEPTTHSRFLDFLARMRCSVITNGIAFADDKFLDETIKAGLAEDNGVLGMMFSLNLPTSGDYEQRVMALENIHAAGKKCFIIAATISDLSQLPIVVEQFNQFKDVAQVFKIRSAFNIGATHGRSHIYLSQLYKAMEEIGGPLSLVHGLNNHTNLLNVKSADKHFQLVFCPDKETIDLNNIGPCGPYAFTHDGRFCNFMEALIINESLEAKCHS